jgi:hypothetical protein
MSGSARGVAAMFIAVAAFSFMDALLKLFAAHYPPVQVTAIRGAASLPFVLLPLWYSGRLAELRPNRVGLHVVRGVLGIVMLATFVLALRDGSLAALRAGRADGAEALLLHEEGLPARHVELAVARVRGGPALAQVVGRHH